MPKESKLKSILAPKGLFNLLENQKNASALECIKGLTYLIVPATIIYRIISQIYY